MSAGGARVAFRWRGRVVACCRVLCGRGGVVEYSLSAASMACSVCVMLGTATAMAAVAPRRVPVARGVVDISMSVTSSAARGRECVSSLAKQARCFAQPPRRPLQASRRRARGVTRIAALICPPHVCCAARAADFHRVFASIGGFRDCKRVVYVFVVLPFNGDAGNARLNCEVFALDGAESARIRVRALSSSSP